MFLQHTPVFFPGKFHGQRSLAGYSSWGHKESNTTEQLSMLMFLRILLSGSIKICSNFKYVYYTSKIILWKNETKEFWTQDSKWWLLRVEGGRGMRWEKHTIRLRLLPRSWLCLGWLFHGFLLDLKDNFWQDNHSVFFVSVGFRRCRNCSFILHLCSEIYNSKRLARCPEKVRLEDHHRKKPHFHWVGVKINVSSEPDRYLLDGRLRKGFT